MSSVSVDTPCSSCGWCDQKSGKVSRNNLDVDAEKWTNHSPVSGVIWTNERTVRTDNAGCECWLSVPACRTRGSRPPLSQSQWRLQIFPDSLQSLPPASPLDHSQPLLPPRPPPGSQGQGHRGGLLPGHGGPVHHLQQGPRHPLECGRPGGRVELSYWSSSLEILSSYWWNLTKLVPRSMP